MSTEWPCPSLKVGDPEVEIMATTGSFRFSGHVTSIAQGRMDTYYTITGGGVDFLLALGSTDYAWRFSRPTLSMPMLAAEPVYGVICTRCNEWYEHAEKKSGFVCYGCRLC